MAKNVSECEVIEDEHGWWLQYPNKQRIGSVHCFPMDATDATEAEHEAMQEGFNKIRICRMNQPVTEVSIDKSDGPR